MLRRIVVGLLGCALAAGAALAQESPLAVSVSSTVTSKYMWNGFDRLETSGLESGPAIQPGVRVGVKNSPLAVQVGGSFAVNNGSELHETTYGVVVGSAVTPLVSVGAGYTYYDNRVTEVGGVNVGDRDDHEVWGALEVSSAVGVRPGVTVKYEKPTQDGADAYEVVVGSLRYGLPLSGVSVGGVGVKLDWNTSVLYNSGVTVGGVETVKSGVSAWQVGVSSDLHAGHVVVRPSVNYQVSVEETVNRDNPVWATVGVSYGF